MEAEWFPAKNDYRAVAKTEKEVMKNLKKMNYWKKAVTFSPPRSAQAIMRPAKKRRSGLKASCDCSSDSGCMNTCS